MRVNDGGGDGGITTMPATDYLPKSSPSTADIQAWNHAIAGTGDGQGGGASTPAANTSPAPPPPASGEKASDDAASHAPSQPKHHKHHWYDRPLGVLHALGEGVGTAGNVLKGVGEGAWDGAKGMAQGVGSLAQGAYGLATSADARQQAMDTAVQDAKAAGQFAQTALTDPGKAAGQVSNAASGAWNQVSTAYQQAAAQGHGAEFIGKAFGQSAVLVGTALVPGGAEAEAAGLAGNAGRVAEVAGDLGKVAEAGADAGKAADASAGLGRATELTTDASKAADASIGTATKSAEATTASEASDGATILEAPGNLGGMEAPRTPDLGERASMPELVQGSAVPGAEGVILNDQVASPAELYGDMFKLSQQNGVEYALTREGSDLILRSGAPDKVAVPRDAEPIAHTHPFDPETEMPQTMPSRADVNALNRRWDRNPDNPRPASDIVWGPEPDQVTRYHATGIDEIPDPMKGGLKPGRTW